MERPDDTDLLRRFVAGDQGALGDLAARYERDLLGLARGFTGSTQLAEEVVQDAWLRVIRSASTFEAQSTVRTWLYRIVINRSRDVRRRESRRPEPPSPDPAPDALDQSELRAAIRDAVDALPGPLRECVLLCHHADLTQEQAAVILAIPLGTLKSRLRTARRRLERALSKEVAT